MENAMSELANMAYAITAIAVGSFIVGHMVVGRHYKRKGGTKRYVELVSSIATVMCLVAGFSAYFRYL